MDLRLRSRFGFEGYEAKDSPHLAGMAERKGSLWLGAAATWHTRVVDLSAELLADASGHSKGHQLTLQAERRFQAGAFDITPRLALQRQDRKAVDYYYGVDTHEARPGRPAYTGSAAVNLQAGVRVGYTLAPRQWLFVDVSSTRLGSAIKNSPLVERSSQPLSCTWVRVRAICALSVWLCSTSSFCVMPGLRPVCIRMRNSLKVSPGWVVSMD